MRYKSLSKLGGFRFVKVVVGVVAAVRNCDEVVLAEVEFKYNLAFIGEETIRANQEVPHMVICDLDSPVVRSTYLNVSLWQRPALSHRRPGTHPHWQYDSSTGCQSHHTLCTYVETTVMSRWLLDFDTLQPLAADSNA